MKTKQHDYICSFLLRPSHPASYFLKFSLPCFNIAALKSSTMIWLKFQIGGQERKDRAPWRLLTSRPSPRIVVKMVHMCVHAYFLKLFAKGSWFPES